MLCSARTHTGNTSVLNALFVSKQLFSKQKASRY
jgi:hypothetical protein